MQFVAASDALSPQKCTFHRAIQTSQKVLEYLVDGSFLLKDAEILVL